MIIEYHIASIKHEGERYIDFVNKRIMIDVIIEASSVYSALKREMQKSFDYNDWKEIKKNMRFQA